MSCMIMSPEPLAAIANATAILLDSGFEYFGFDATHRMHEAFQNCRTCGFYAAEEIYRKLYTVNAAAYNGRYRGRETPADEMAPVIDGSCYRIHQPPEYSEHHHAVRPWHYCLAKLLDFWLFQTGEDTTWQDPVRVAMADFKTALFEFIVQRSDEYDNVPAWGKLQHETGPQGKPERRKGSNE